MYRARGNGPDYQSDTRIRIVGLWLPAGSRRNRDPWRCCGGARSRRSDAKVASDPIAPLRF